MRKPDYALIKQHLEWQLQQQQQPASLAGAELAGQQQAAILASELAELNSRIFGKFTFTNFTPPGGQQDDYDHDDHQPRTGIIFHPSNQPRRPNGTRTTMNKLRVGCGRRWRWKDN